MLSQALLIFRIFLQFLILLDLIIQWILFFRPDFTPENNAKNQDNRYPYDPKRSGRFLIISDDLFKWEFDPWVVICNYIFDSWFRVQIKGFWLLAVGAQFWRQSNHIQLRKHPIGGSSRGSVS